jgi:hypothetical protein
MSSRFGWVIAGANLKARENELIADFRNSQPIHDVCVPAEERIMRNAENDLEICLGFDNSTTLLQGQCVLGLAEERLTELLIKYSQATFMIWLCVEGTTESRFFRKYENGKIVQGYGAFEGKAIPHECLGAQPQGNEHGQVGDWELIALLEGSGIQYDDLCKMTLRVMQFEAEKQVIPESPTPGKRWWKFWK